MIEKWTLLLSYCFNWRVRVWDRRGPGLCLIISWGGGSPCDEATRSLCWRRFILRLKYLLQTGAWYMDQLWRDRKTSSRKKTLKNSLRPSVSWLFAPSVSFCSRNQSFKYIKYLIPSSLQFLSCQQFNWRTDETQSSVWTVSCEVCWDVRYYSDRVGENVNII